MANVKFFTEDDVEDGKATVVPETYTITGLTQEEYDLITEAVGYSIHGMSKSSAARLYVTLLDNKVIQ